MGRLASGFALYAAVACGGNATGPAGGPEAPSVAEPPAGKPEPPASPSPATPGVVPAQPADASPRPTEAETGPNASTAGHAPPRSEGGATCEDGTHRPGERWKVDCNTCTCAEDGRVLCTRMACRPPKDGDG